jgi:hypothetical protein
MSPAEPSWAIGWPGWGRGRTWMTAIQERNDDCHRCWHWLYFLTPNSSLSLVQKRSTDGICSFLLMCVLLKFILYLDQTNPLSCLLFHHSSSSF